MNKQLIQLGCLVALAFPLASAAQENVDQAMMQKIRKEGLEHSKVMDIAFNLTDKSGSRLTNSAYSFEVVIPSGKVIAAATITSCQPQKVNAANLSLNSRT